VPTEIEMLTAGVARGDEPAIERFYRRFFALLYHTARQASGRDESFCLDVVQESLLRILRTIRPVTTESQLVAWLRLIVQSVTYDALRRERRRQERETRAVQHAARATDDRAAVAERGESQTAERLAWLRCELLRLDPRLVRLIELRYAHGWTLGRIGAALGLSGGAVDGRLRRALAELRQRAPEVSHDYSA
jgi:RNA polymerase sigma factor (sigma-70 family)